jgi:hypothetical protein
MYFKKLTSIAMAAFAVIFIGLTGCKKDAAQKPESPVSSKIIQTASIPAGMVQTPGGLMVKSQVHLIEQGYHLEVSNNHVLKVRDNTGALTEDFGVIKTPAGGSSTQQGPGFSNLNNAPALNSYTTYSEWGNTNGQTINSFSTKWLVPSNPTATGALFYIMDALEPYQVEANNAGNLAMEPALQWGTNGVFGGSYWTISNWCVWSGGSAYTSPVTSVAPGTLLQGAITFTGTQSDGSYNYTSAFNGYSNAMNLTQGTVYNNLGTGTVGIPFIPIENWAYEVLETFGWTQDGNYPVPNYVAMSNISVQTGPVGTYTPAPLAWSAVTHSGFASNGEHTVVVSNNSSGSGEVDLYYRNPAPPSTNFAITDNSGNGLSLTFVRTDISTQPYINIVVYAHTSTTHISIPNGIYTIRWNPAQSPPVNCVVSLNTGQQSPSEPGGQFTGIGIGVPGYTTSLTAN